MNVMNMDRSAMYIPTRTGSAYGVRRNEEERTRANTTTETVGMVSPLRLGRTDQLPLGIDESLGLECFRLRVELGVEVDRPVVRDQRGARGDVVACRQRHQ